MPAFYSKLKYGDAKEKQAGQFKVYSDLILLELQRNYCSRGHKVGCKYCQGNGQISNLVNTGFPLIVNLAKRDSLLKGSFYPRSTQMLTLNFPLYLQRHSLERQLPKFKLVTYPKGKYVNKRTEVMHMQASISLVCLPLLYLNKNSRIPLSQERIRQNYKI